MLMVFKRMLVISVFFINFAKISLNRIFINLFINITYAFYFGILSFIFVYSFLN
jgi:hypothetical protein